MSVGDKFVVQFLLNIAKAKGYGSMTHLLTHFGADINMQDGCGNTILIFLLPEGCYIERLLVENVVRPGVLY